MTIEKMRELLERDEVIKSCVPGYMTDAIYRVENIDRYDDRLIVSSNLIESYDKLMEFVAKHTSDKFHLIDNTSVSLRDLIAREIVSNILVHRDYTSAFPAKLIIEKNWIRTENWCKPMKHGRLLAEEFTPYPKNPLITDFFVTIGRADTLGSGVRNLYKFTPIYSTGGKPELFEDDIFRITIPLNADAGQELKELTELTSREQQIYDMIKENPKISIDDIAADYDVTRRTILREIQEIKKKVYLAYDKKEAKWGFDMRR